MTGEVITAYEQVTRTRLEVLEEKFYEHEKAQADTLREIRDELKSIHDKLNTRLPSWVSIIFWFVGIIIGFLLGVKLPLG